MSNAPGPAKTHVRVQRPGSIKSAKRTISAARGRARQFWGVFDRSLVPMVTVDNDRRYEAANRAARLLFRLSLAEMREHRINDFTPPHMEMLLEDVWARLLRDGAVDGRYDVLFPDGSQLRIVYCAIANALPGQHLIVFAPAEWPEDELGTIEEDAIVASPTPLSHREQEVLTSIAAGADLEQIAEELSISPHTVRKHVMNAQISERVRCSRRASSVRPYDLTTIV